MAYQLPEGVEMNMDEAFFNGDIGSDTDSSAASSEAPIDYHQEAYPAYQPPHKRGHNLDEADKTVNFKKQKDGKDDPDKIEGVDNDKYQRLKLKVNFALRREDLAKLKPDFPGIYFHAADNCNHDHPKSHLVTQIGTRLLQRMIPSGSRVLDVYGNPKASTRFNVSQAEADNPKEMRALVYNFGGADYLREVNKWGPIEDDEGNGLYDRMLFSQCVNQGHVEQYDILQFIHTLYYVDFSTLVNALHAPGKKRKALALIHSHKSDMGTVNYGEQKYEKQTRGNITLVKQTNVKTNTSYYHKDLYNILFGPTKEWYPTDTMATRSVRGIEHDRGFTWDLKEVNSDTWIVEMVGCHRRQPVDGEGDENIDYEELWAQNEELSELDTPDSSVLTAPMLKGEVMMIPAPDGKVLQLDLSCQALFKVLRASCAGKTRDAKLIDELMNQARHLVNPSAMFGNKEKMDCPEEKLYDHVIGAVFADLEQESNTLAAASKLLPMMRTHAMQRKLGNRLKDCTLTDVMDLLRQALGVARSVNSIYPGNKIIESTLLFAQDNI